MSDFLFGPIGEKLLELIQSFSNPVLDLYFGIITTLGDTLPILIIIILLYYTINKEFINKVIYVLIFSAHLNTVAKIIFHNPRPFQYDIKYQKITNVFGMETTWSAGGYSFPSGHSNTQGAFWGYVFSRYRTPVYIILGFLLLTTIPLSRTYLGVHWPSDILIGVLFGLLIAYSFLYAEKRYGESLRNQSNGKKIILGFCGSFGLVILGLIALFLGTILPFNQQILITDPFVWDEANIGTYPGILAGFIAGQVLEKKYVDFKIRRENKKIIAIRSIIGLVTVIVLYLVAGKIEDLATEFSDQIAWSTTIANYFSYLLIAFFLAFIIPWIFTKIESLIFSD